MARRSRDRRQSRSSKLRARQVADVRTVETKGSAYSPVPRGTFTAKNARDRIARELPQIIKQPGVYNGPKPVLKTPEPVSRMGLEKPVAKRPEKDKTQKPVQTELKLEQDKKCKPQPSRNRGDGNSRRFVPWCK